MYDTIDAEMESFDFEVNVIATRDKNFKFPTQPVLNVSYELLEQIETHPDLLFERPCAIGGKVLFEIVREYLSSNSALQFYLQWRWCYQYFQEYR